MCLRECILTGAVELIRLIIALIYGDSLLACSAVAGGRICENGVISRDNAAAYERVYYRIEAACIAAGNSNSVLLRYLLAVSGRKLRKAVSPVRICSVSR